MALRLPASLSLTSHLNVPTAGKRQSLYVVFDDLAETCVFSKQSQLSFFCGHLAVAPLIANLRGQFAEFLHVWFSRAPEAIRLALLCQIWYGHRSAPAKFFSDGLPVGSPLGLLTTRRLRERIFLSATPSRKPASNSRTTFYPPSLLVQCSRWCRNVDLLPIDYAFQPRLRDRLTLGGIAWPRKP